MDTVSLRMQSIEANAAQAVGGVVSADGFNLPEEENDGQDAESYEDENYPT